TRGREKLYLLHARSRRRLGTTQLSMPSSFLDPIPAELLERRTAPRLSRGGGHRTGRGANWYSDGWDSAPRSRRGSSAATGLVIDYSDAQDMPRFIKGEIV